MPETSTTEPASNEPGRTPHPPDVRTPERRSPSVVPRLTAIRQSLNMVYQSNSGWRNTPNVPSNGLVSPLSHRSDKRVDPLKPFGPAILAVRWATTAVSLVLATIAVPSSGSGALLWAFLATANTAYRTFRPMALPGSHRALASLIAETALHTAAVAATGYWDSPLVLLLPNTTIIAGFARSYRFAVGAALATAASVTLLAIGVGDWTSNDWAHGAQWATLLVLSGAVAGYSRRLSGEAHQLHSQALDRVAKLADANTLLTRLHRVAQSLPASLDESDVLDSSLARLKALVHFDSAVILLLDESDGSWIVTRDSGLALPRTFTDDQMPAPAMQAIDQSRVVSIGSDTTKPLPTTSRSFFDVEARSAVYVPLLARSRLVGLLAVERFDQVGFSHRDRQLLAGFVEPVALSIDNARLFSRIRVVGADEERTRIARDLHDRVGQSMAFLGFELDRLLRIDDTPPRLVQELGQLRTDLRQVVSEVRETLYDLRTEVTETRGLSETIHEFAERLAQRSGLTINLDCERQTRLPILQEREMWHIALEALTNVERHAQATEVAVQWRCDEQHALLQIADNGIGLPEPSSGGRLGRTDSYGIIGMRERAVSIGASLEMISSPGEGTTIKCFLAHK